MGARRSLHRLLVAVVTGALAAGAIAVGCATGSEQPAEVPPTETGPGGDSTFGDGGADSGGDTAAIDSKGTDGKTGDTKPLFDSDLFCGDIGAANTCDKVIDLGTAPLGGSGATKGNIPLTGGDVWYKVAFEGLDNPAAHPKIVLEGPPVGIGFRFEVLKSCAREPFTCGATEDALPSKLTEFEGSYEDSAVGDTSDDAFVPIALGAGGAIYIRVYRPAGAPTNCDGYTLKVTN
ncbi:MAG: hypothetical protein ABI175_09685 [Polyangiales bacterium]